MSRTDKDVPWEVHQARVAILDREGEPKNWHEVCAFGGWSKGTKDIRRINNKARKRNARQVIRQAKYTKETPDVPRNRFTWIELDW